MKTQHFGVICTCSIHSSPSLVLAALQGYRTPYERVLKSYRENRENGTDQDNPKTPFPSAGFESLDIKDSNWKSANDWPDKQGRYWWKFTLNDGRVVEDFYCTKDKVRGFPDKKNKDCYWFIVHHKNGTKIEGFSQKPNHEKGFPDSDKNYWYDVHYTECGPIKAWMEEKGKNYLARLEREKQIKRPSIVRRQLQPSAQKLQPTMQEAKPTAQEAKPPSFAVHHGGSTSAGFLHMKTQSFGTYRGNLHRSGFPAGGLVRFFSYLSVNALKNYRENRENGAGFDNSTPFPSAGFDTLNITKYGEQTEKWPDREGRHWWKFTLNDGRIMEDFYWTKDDVRGYPDKSNKNRHWFIVHHAPSGTKIEGFSQEPDYEKGFPDKDKKYWYTIQYTESDAMKAWMTDKDKHYLARLEKTKQPEMAQHQQPLEKAPKRDMATPPQIQPQPLIQTMLALDVDAQELLDMKTQHFGRTGPFAVSPRSPIYLVTSSPLFEFPPSLKNYRISRENGTEQDNPNPPFPSAGFDALDIQKSDWKSLNDWPDIEGRYWWKFTLYDGRVVEDFYWTKDEVRGYPDKNNNDRCWFIVHHKNGTQIEGFSLEPHHEKGFPDNDKNYWRYIQYTECGPIKAWMEEKDRNYCARLEREKKAKEPNVAWHQQPLEKTPKHDIATPPQMQPPPQKPQPTVEESTRRPGHLTLNALGRSHVDVVLPYEDLTFGKLLGKGGFGAVYEGNWQGVPVAIKKLFERQLTQKLEAEFRHEAGMMVQLRHPHIVVMYGITLNPENCMVLELMTKGSLYSVLHSDEPMSWQLRYNIGLDAAKGLAYLHDKHILHRDLKSLNVLLDKDYRAKLGDFGLSTIKATSTQIQQAGLAGTLQWIAPELFLDTLARYTQACDVYSFAMIVWELMSREQPYRHIRVPARIFIHVGEGNREPIPQEAPSVLQQTTQQGWAQAPEKRPNMREVVNVLINHPVTDNTPMSSPHHASSDASSASSSSSFFQSSDSNRYSSGESQRNSPSTSSDYVANIASKEPQKRKGSKKANTDSGYLHQSYQMASSSSGNALYFSTYSSLPLPEPEDDTVLEARAMHSYRAKEANQLSFSKGATLQVIEQDHSGWWLCELAGKQGLAPSNYLRLLDMAHELSRSNSSYGGY